MLNDVPEKWGPTFKVDGGEVARARKVPNSFRFVAPAPMALVMFTPQPDRQIAHSDRAISGTTAAGSLEIIPAQVVLHAPWNIEKRDLLLAVDAGRLERLAGVEFNTETFELHPPKHGRVDSKAHQFAHWIRNEVENKGLSWNECVDALVTVFATHLLRNHSSLHNRSMRPYSGGLPPAIWRRVDDFIHGNLSDCLSLKRLACVARLSPSHLARAFKQTTGQSAHQYVISSRLAYARDLITSTDTPLSQIAKMAGFSSNSHMTTLMRRAWRVTPTDLRRGGSAKRHIDGH